MPTYRITTPDGRTFRLSGQGSKEQAWAQFWQTYNSKTKEGLKLSNPGEYDPGSKAYREKYGAASGQSGFENFASGVGAQAVNRAASLGNMLSGAGDAIESVGKTNPLSPGGLALAGLGKFAGSMTDERRAELMARNEDVLDTKGGKAGALTADIAATLPFGASLGGATAGGAFLGLSDPNAQSGMDRLKSTAMGAGFGLGGGALGKWGSAALTRNLARARINRANAAPMVETLARGQKAGLVAPPATTNPSLLNRMLESFAGKEAIEQEAALMNAGKMQEAARRYLGVADDMPLKVENLRQLRASRAPIYDDVNDVIDKIGGVGGDKRFVDDLLALEKRWGGSSKFQRLLPEYRDIRLMGRDLRKGTPYSGNEAMKLVADLRKQAGKAFANRQKSLGHAQRDAADAIERLMEREIGRRAAGNLGRGSVGRRYARGLINDWRAARVADAKTYAVERVMNQATGNLQGAKMARELARGAPLSGEMKDMAKFVSAFTSTGKEPTRSAGVNALTTLFGVESAMLGHPGPLVLTPARLGMGKLLLSKPYQKYSSVPKFKPGRARVRRGLGRVLAPFAMNQESDED